jgi:predicted ATPase
MSARSVSDIERGLQRHPYPGTIKRLEDALGLDPGRREAFQVAWQTYEGDSSATAADGRLLRLAPHLAARPTNLPDDPTPFIGRSDELEAVSTLLRDPAVRLLTLTGTGGAGKTRLALRAAGALLPEYGDGVFLVALAPLSDPGHVTAAIAAVLDVSEETGAPLLARLADRLSAKHILIVLDNFEHVLPAATVVASLLDVCRGLHILATSRVPLRLSREREYAVPPLRAPEIEAGLDLPALASYDAVAFFAERARAVRADFVLTARNAAAVAEICATLEGLPLAIELAAARVKLLSPDALLDRLSNRLRLLGGGPVDRPARLRSMRAAIDWSYELLSPPEQTLCTRLSVFAGGCSLDAMQAVCADNIATDLLESVAGLVDKSLLRQATPAGPGDREPRFSMLHVIREYGAERLERMGQSGLVADRHAGYFLELALQADAGLQGPDQGLWIAHLAREIDNLRGALARLLATGRVADELRMASVLSRFWVYRGLWQEGERWLRAGLEGEGEVPERVRAWALTWLGELAWQRGDYERQLRLEEAAVAIFRRLSEPAGIARAQSFLALGLVWQGEHERASVLALDSLELSRRHGCRSEEGQALNVLGTAAAPTDRDAARRWMDAALAVHRDLGDHHRIALNLGNLGSYALAEGDILEAESRLREALAIAEELEIEQIKLYSLAGLGRLAHLRGEQIRAARFLRRALALAAELGAKGNVPDLLGSLAGVEAARGHPERAARLAGAERAIRESLGLPPTAGRHSALRAGLEPACEVLGEERFEELARAGAELQQTEALAFALDETES